MCGIIGGTNQEWDFESSVASLTHRGPDSKKIVRDPNFTLAFTRLAIIDLSHNADQPMSAQNDTVRIVFNGEIYDFKSLRQELETKGHKFKSSSDTEVLLNAYLEWGDQFTDHVDGMFAIALYDIKAQNIKLLRDRVGIKPLYYYADGQNFAFASELKALTTLCKNISLSYDMTAVYDYLSYLYIPEPKTLYKNIYKLPPAHQLTFALKNKTITHIKPYWQLNTNPSSEYGTVDAAKEKLTSLINDSVKDQLVADVPVGFFLSGGMDSSVVVKEASSLTHPQTFTIGFDVKEHNEIHYAEEVATHFKTKHKTKILSATDTENMLMRLKDWFDEPFADTSAFPTYLVSKHARENVTVALTGDGGDEVFGGYKWYSFFNSIVKKPFFNHSSLNHLLHNCKSTFPYGSFLHKVFNRFDLLTSDDLAGYTKLLGGMTTAEKKPYASEWGIPDDYDSYWHFRKYYRDDLPLFTRLQYLDFHTYLPGDILTKVDRTSMSVSLEVRVPLLSKDIVEFSFALPEDIRYYHHQLKGLMKQAYRESLPQNIIERGKKGFSIPRQYIDQNIKRKQEHILKNVFNLNI